MSQHAFFTLSPTMLAPPSLSGAHTLAPPSPHRARRDARAALATGRAVSLLELTAGPTEFSGSSPIALPHTPQSALAPTSSSYSSSVSLPCPSRHPTRPGGCAPDGEGGACDGTRPVARAVRACARPMARAARAARPVATGEGSASVGAPCGVWSPGHECYEP